MRIAIIGPGAMGILYAGLLSQYNDVDLIGKSIEKVEYINKNGITIRNNDNSQIKCKVKAYLSGTVSKKYDLIIVFVKDTSTNDAIESNKNLFLDSVMVLSLQNGMGNQEILEKHIKKENIFLGTSKHNSVTEGYGEIYHAGTGMTDIGSVVFDKERSNRIVDIFNKAGIECQYNDNVKRLLWSKLFVNMTINSITSIVECKIGNIISNPNVKKVAENVVREAVKVSSADGVDITYEEACSNVFGTATRLSTGYASMYQDIKNKKKTEVDYINGYVVKKGIEYGIDTPLNNMILSLVHAKESAEK